ncbi:MAG: sialidase family protein [Planctomycetota bacterium]
MKRNTLAALGLLFLGLALVGGCPFTPGNTASDLELRFNVGGTPTAVPSNGEPVFQTQPIFNNIAGKSGSHAPTVTALPDGELLAAWYSYDGPHELDGAAIYTARRPAGSDTWTTPQLHIDRAAADGNPVLYSEGDDVWLFQAVVTGTGWSTSRIEVQRSGDRGQSWSAAQSLGGPLGSNVRFAPVRTAGGALLLPAYDDLWQRSLFFTSADGESWTLTAALSTTAPNQNIQPSATVLSDGRLLAVMRNTGGGWLWVTASDDNGHSWAAPIDSGFPNPGSPAALLRLASGNLILVYNNSDTLRRPLSISISADEGMTWLPARVLVDGDGEYAYPATIQTPDGLVHIVYSHDRRYIGHITLNEAWITGG